MIFLTYILTVGRMSKGIQSKNHTIRRLRRQRDILWRAAQAPVKEVRESDDKENQERAHARVVQESLYYEKEDSRKSS